MIGRRPRVGLVAACRFPEPRGSQVLIDQMACALAGSGVQTHLIAPLAREWRGRPYRVNAAAVARRGAGVDVTTPIGAALRALFDARLAAFLGRVVRRERIDVLHAHNYEGLVAALAVRRLHGVSVVYHSHNVMADELPFYAPAPLQRAARRLGAWCDRTLPRLADHVVALSADVGEHLCRAGVAAERLSVVPPGLEPGPFAAENGQRRGGARSAVFAGNLDGYQNLDLLLDAWAIAATGDPGIRLTLVTQAPRAVVERGLGRRPLGDRVRLVAAGSLAEVAAELASATVGVSPRSSWSGFPIKTLNYMASALPTVALAASAKGVRDGETGWVVPEATAPALAQTLAAALDDPVACARRGRAAREALADEHSWSLITPRLLELSSGVRAGGGAALPILSAGRPLRAG